jgi:hypothetical protein
MIFFGPVLRFSDAFAAADDPPLGVGRDVVERETAPAPDEAMVTAGS